MALKEQVAEIRKRLGKLREKLDSVSDETFEQIEPRLEKLLDDVGEFVDNCKTSKD